jgi:hypothetical protein
VPIWPDGLAFLSQRPLAVAETADIPADHYLYLRFGTLASNTSRTDAHCFLRHPRCACFLSGHHTKRMNCELGIAAALLVDLDGEPAAGLESLDRLLVHRF